MCQEIAISVPGCWIYVVVEKVRCCAEAQKTMKCETSQLSHGCKKFVSLFPVTQK